MKTPKHKINVQEICEALNACGIKILTRKTFYRHENIHGSLDGISLRPARGQCYEENITGFTLYVGQRTGVHGKIFSYHEEKVEGADWKSRMPEICALIITKAREWAAIEETRRANCHEAYKARKEYAEVLNKVLPEGRQISEWNLLTGEGKKPVGYALTVHLLGTAEAVAARIKKALETI